MSKLTDTSTSNIISVIASYRRCQPTNVLTKCLRLRGGLLQFPLTCGMISCKMRSSDINMQNKIGEQYLVCIAFDCTKWRYRTSNPTFVDLGLERRPGDTNRLVKEFVNEPGEWVAIENEETVVES